MSSTPWSTKHMNQEVTCHSLCRSAAMNEICQRFGISLLSSTCSPLDKLGSLQFVLSGMIGELDVRHVVRALNGCDVHPRISGESLSVYQRLAEMQFGCWSSLISGENFSDLAVLYILSSLLRRTIIVICDQLPFRGLFWKFSVDFANVLTLQGYEGEADGDKIVIALIGGGLYHAVDAFSLRASAFESFTEVQVLIDAVWIESREATNEARNAAVYDPDTVVEFRGMAEVEDEALERDPENVRIIYSRLFR